jgi:acyl-CoA synthetase (AMP-forming)/AMP-acid ligase II/thioesterase domain-containing protein
MTNHAASRQPSSAETLIDLLEAVATTAEAGVTLYPPSSSQSVSVGAQQKALRLSYGELLSSAEEKAYLLLQNIPVLTERKVVLIHLDHHVDSIPWFWAVVYAGLLPALLPPLSSNPRQREQNLQHLTALLDNPLILTTENLLKRFPELQQPGTYTIESLQSHTNGANDATTTNGEFIARFLPPRGDEPCVLMLTSGSTGNSKAVSLTVPQILASVRGKGRARNTTKNWVLLNWIGLDHVANLTEIHLHALYQGAEQVQVQSSDVISDPLFFLHLLHKHRVSYSFAPNFFLALLSKKLAAADPSDPIFSIDLSSLEGIVSGGEANVVETAKMLTEQLNALGAQGPSLFVGYGLTEACAALTYSTFDPEYETREGHEFASIGKTIEGAKIRVQTPEGTSAEPYQVGELQLSGDVVFKNYYRDPIATANSFTKDGWFASGDQGYIDREGKLNLVGRTKEILIINGVNCSPQDIENALETADIPGVLLSYFATFSHRPKGSDTEGYCVIYSPQNTFENPEVRDRVIETIARTASAIAGVRPDWVVPLPAARLEKSSLGKLSRSKLKKEFNNGTFDDMKIRSKKPIQSSRQIVRVAPTTQTEQNIVEVLSEMLEMPVDMISVDQTIFELGITSITLFRFEQLLRTRFDLGAGVSIITFLNSPVIRHIANAIDNINSNQYDPVALLQARGTKHPLWLVHPASGNVLAFLPLARTMVDRPLYALSSRGLGVNERLFSSIPEMADTYREHVKRVQPTGPYAVMGYSLGTTVAYELAKRLEASGDEVVFCGALDSPPHIIPLLGHLDWTAAAVRVAYFLELIAQDDIPTYEKEVRGESQAPIEVVKRLLELARPEQLAKLNLTPEQLMAIVNVTDNFGTSCISFLPYFSLCLSYFSFFRSVRAEKAHNRHQS